MLNKEIVKKIRTSVKYILPSNNFWSTKGLTTHQSDPKIEKIYLQLSPIKIQLSRCDTTCSRSHKNFFELTLIVRILCNNSKYSSSVLRSCSHRKPLIMHLLTRNSAQNFVKLSKILKARGNTWISLYLLT